MKRSRIDIYWITNNTPGTKSVLAYKFKYAVQDQEFEFGVHIHPGSKTQYNVTHIASGKRVTTFHKMQMLGKGEIDSAKKALGALVEDLSPARVRAVLAATTK